MSNDSDAFLLEAFRRLHGQAVRWFPARPTQRTPSAEDLAAAHKELAAALEQQADAARRAGVDSSSEEFKEAQFAMALVIDTLAVARSGCAPNAWKSLSAGLAAPLYPGERGLKRLVERQDATQPALVKVYLAALALGLPLEPDPGMSRETYSLKLWALLEQGEAGFATTSPLLFPEAYVRQQQGGPPDYLPQLSGWVWALVITLSMVVLYSYPLWRQATAEVRNWVERILPLLP